MPVTEYQISEARAKLKDIYDRAEEGNLTLIKRGKEASVALLPVDLLKQALRQLAPLDPVIASDSGRVDMWVPDLPVHASGDSLESSASALVEALRDYAELWEQELKRSPGHAAAWPSVMRIQLLDDAELADALFEMDT